MAEWRREKVKRQRSQDMVEEYDWSHFMARHVKRSGFICHATSGSQDKECSTSDPLISYPICDIHAIYARASSSEGAGPPD